MSRSAHIRFSSILLFLLYAARVNAQHITIVQQDTATSIRGLSVVNDNIAWISGSKGHVGFTINGGKTWSWQQVKGFKEADFRDIEAFSDKEAIIMSSGTPALILKTKNGGKSWTKKYCNIDTAYFFDAMDFADAKHGFVLGDPINGKFVLLETKDGGETWEPFQNQPEALPGESCFAASGTCLRVNTSAIGIITGGTHSRLLTYPLSITPSDDWVAETTGLKAGISTQGAFSFAQNGTIQIFVGGDYNKNNQKDSVASYILYCCYANAINYPKVPPSGYQSCVEYIKENIFLSTGTAGTNITIDGGKTWWQIDTASFNVCRKAKRGTLILLAGDKGKIAIFNP